MPWLKSAASQRTYSPSVLGPKAEMHYYKLVNVELVWE